jgi:hypothetical protein
MQVGDRRFEPANIFLPKRAADIEVKGGKPRAMEDSTDSPDDNEIKAVGPEPREQRLVILRQVIDRRLAPPAGSR